MGERFVIDKSQRNQYYFEENPETHEFVVSPNLTVTECLTIPDFATRVIKFNEYLDDLNHDLYSSGQDNDGYTFECVLNAHFNSPHVENRETLMDIYRWFLFDDYGEETGHYLNRWFIEDLRTEMHLGTREATVLTAQVLTLAEGIRDDLEAISENPKSRRFVKNNSKLPFEFRRQLMASGFFLGSQLRSLTPDQLNHIRTTQLGEEFGKPEDLGEAIYAFRIIQRRGKYISVVK